MATRIRSAASASRCRGGLAAAGRRLVSTRSLREEPYYAQVREVISDGGRQFNLGQTWSIDEHLRAFAAFASLLAPHLVAARGRSIVDLGAGSGALGLLCAFAYPDVMFTLVDCRERSCDFMWAAVHKLSLTGRVRVVHERAEGMGRAPAHRHAYDGVLSRRFGPPARTAESAAPLLKRHGFLLVSDPRPDTGETSDVRWPAAGLSRVGLVLESTIAEPAYASVLRAVEPCGDAYPRSRKLKGGSKALY